MKIVRATQDWPEQTQDFKSWNTYTKIAQHFFEKEVKVGLQESMGEEEGGTEANPYNRAS